MGNPDGKRKTLLLYDQHFGSKEKDAPDSIRKMFYVDRQAVVSALVVYLPRTLFTVSSLISESNIAMRLYRVLYSSFFALTFDPPSIHSSILTK